MGIDRQTVIEHIDHNMNMVRQVAVDHTLATTTSVIIQLAVEHTGHNTGKVRQVVFKNTTHSNEHHLRQMYSYTLSTIKG